MSSPVSNRIRTGLAASLLALLLLALPSESRAEEGPSNRDLVLAGMAMGIPTYILGVSVHEGSHALAAKAMGVRITDYSLIPGFHPRNGKFYFGYVSVIGLRTQRQRAWFLAAPKLTDSLLLGGFSLLYATDSMPANEYGQTALLVLATGFWVDFSRDIVAYWDHNDTVKLYEIWGLGSELERLPARLVHLGLSVGMGYAIYRGYQDLFSDEAEMAPPVLLPLWDSSF